MLKCYFPVLIYQNLWTKNGKQPQLTCESAVSWFPSKWLCLYCSFLVCFLFLQLLMIKCFQEQYSLNCLNFLSSVLFSLQSVMEWSRVNLSVSLLLSSVSLALINIPKLNIHVHVLCVLKSHVSIWFWSKNWMNQLRDLKDLGCLGLAELFSSDRLVQVVVELKGMVRFTEFFKLHIFSYK